MNPTYERRKAAGICVNCGLKPALPGIFMCEECRNDHRVRDKKRMDIRIAQHRCTHCGVPLPKDDPRVKCQKCSDMDVLYLKRSRKRRSEQLKKEQPVREEQPHTLSDYKLTEEMLQQDLIFMTGGSK